MSNPWVGGLITAVVVAILGFVFGLLNLHRNTVNQRAEELRRRRVDVYAAFCAAVVDYRRAQLHRWYVGQRLGPPEVVEENAPEVAADVRKSRAAAWGRFYEVLMICNDEQVEQQARLVLRTAKSIKLATTADEVDRLSNVVHDQVNDFARIAGQTVLAGKQREFAPPPDGAQPRGTAVA